MRIYRVLVIAICGSFLLSLPLASETELQTDQEFSCETLTFFYGLWKDSAFGQNPNGVERAAWIIHEENGSQIFQKWRNSGERNREFWKGPIPVNVVGVVHTHPAQRDAKPSPADVSFAKNLNIPVYVISAKGIWMSNSKGKISRVMNYDRFKEGLGVCGSLNNTTATKTAEKDS